jgi:hypothetical protein
MNDDDSGCDHKEQRHGRLLASRWPPLRHDVATSLRFLFFCEIGRDADNYIHARTLIHINTSSRFHGPNFRFFLGNKISGGKVLPLPNAISSIDTRVLSTNLLPTTCRRACTTQLG